MACTPQEVRKAKIAEAIEYLKKKSDAKTIEFNSESGVVIITPDSSSKIPNTVTAKQVGQRLVDDIMNHEEYGLDYKRFGPWSEPQIVNGKVELRFSFPSNLMKSLQKQYEETSIDEAYSERSLEERMLKQELMLNDQMEYDSEYFDDLPQQSLDKLDFSVLIDYKKLMRDRVEKISQTLHSLYSHNKSADVKLKINEISKIKFKIESDLGALMNPDTIFEDTLRFIEEDLATIDTLLDNNNISNLQTAEKMIGFYERISDYSYENRGNNPFIDINTIYDAKGNLVLETEISQVLDNLAKLVQQKKSKLDVSKQSYLKDIVSKSPHIQALYPGLNANSLLKDLEDIGLVSKTFLSVDKQFSGKDSLLSQLIKIELEVSRGRNKGYVNELIAELNAVLPKVQKKLPKIQGIFNSGFLSETDYSNFYQQNSNGRKTGRIIDKFSDNWFNSFRGAMESFNKSRLAAMKNKDWDKVNKSLLDKYKWLNSNANFFDITQVPEIVNAPEFQEFDTFFSISGANSYKDTLIKEIGEFYYNKLVAKQLEALKEFKDWKIELVQSVLADHNVGTAAELPAPIRYNLETTILRNNPFELMKSHNMGNGSELQSGSFVYPSNLKHIEYFPKKVVPKYNKQTNQVEQVDSNYYDSNFMAIEQDEDLSHFWQILEEATHYMNMTLADAEKMLKHGSILSMKKSFTEILIDPESSIAAKAIILSNNLKQWLSAQFTTRTVNDKNADDYQEINKSQFKTNENDISQKLQLELLKINRIAGYNITSSKLKNGMPYSVEKYLKELSGENDVSNITDITAFVKDVITDKVINEQTFNLPVLLRAYLEMTAEYKAQKESLPQLSVYKEFYNNVKRDSTNDKVDTNNKLYKAYNSIANRSGLSTERVNAQQRMNYWFNKNVLGNVDNNMWLNMGKGDFWLLSSFNKIEKELKKELELQLKDQALTDDEKLEIVNEIAQLGSNFALSSVYAAVVNKFQIFQGLAYNIKANLFNRFQGWFQGMAYDNGAYWTEGNFQVATGFTARRVARFLPGMNNYTKQIDISKLLIDQMGILQDATNEIDRARNGTGITGIVKKISPFYATEYTEWNNQAPQILAILMDKTIKDDQGNEVAIFDGRNFGPYDIENGKLVLKPEFNTLENQKEWLEFSTDDATNSKNYISEIISLINGDYSKTGGVYAKKTSLGKTLMMFKTWMPNAIYTRFAGIFDIEGQTNLVLGKSDYKGIYASHKASTGMLTGAITGTLVAGLPGTLIGGALGALGGGWVNKKQGGSLGLDLNIAKDAATVGTAMIKKMIGMPVNFISGKDLVKNHQLGNMATTPEDLQRLKSIVGELSVLMSMILFKLMVKGLLGPNDDEEPKTVMVNGKKVPNPYYGTNLQSDREKMMHNVLENEVTRIINDLTVYVNPSAMYDNISRTALVGLFDDITKIADAYVKYNQGVDELQTGPNAGESRLFNSVAGATLPGLFQDPTTLGFGKSMETEYKKGEYFDSMFYSDYKQDKKVITATRTVQKELLTQQYQKELYYSNQSEEVRLELDTFIDKQVRSIMKYSSEYNINRFLYDAEQESVE